MHYENLLRKLKDKSAVIAVIGMGYVGLPLALCFHDKGFPVIGFDIDPEKVDMLTRGESYLKHINQEKVKGLATSTRFFATNDASKLAAANGLIICVPTPLNRYREPDISFIVNTMDNIAPYLQAGQVVSLESTTYPGTTEEELRPRIEKQGLIIGEDVFLVFSPEREDPGNAHFNTHTIPKVVGGSTERCLQVGITLYSEAISQVVPVSSTQAAEMTKLLENIFRAVNIGLVNEMKMVADRMGIDIWEVIAAAATKPFGYTPFYPGPGLGGHCIPIDPFYLTWKAREYEMHTRFIELAGEVNTKMPEWVVGKIADALNDKKKSVNGSKILVIGIAYKKNIDDMRESPAVHLMQLLQEKGAIVAYHDDYVPVFPKMRKYKFTLNSTDITPETLKEFDCVLIATDHDYIDYALIKEHADLIVDTRGKYKQAYLNVIKA